MTDASILTIEQRAAGFSCPSALFAAMQDAGTLDSARRGLGRETLLEKRLVWVLLRTELRVYRAPARDAGITLSTWAGMARHAFFPRHYLWRNERGEPLARASTLWTMMDIDTRAMALPASRGISVGAGVRLPDELPTPAAIPANAFDGAAETRAYTPCPRDLDDNGHVNNVRYVDWFMDGLPPERRAGCPARVLVHYLAETRAGEALTLTTANADGFSAFAAEAGGKRRVAAYAEWAGDGV